MIARVVRFHRAALLATEALADAYHKQRPKDRLSRVTLSAFYGAVFWGCTVGFTYSRLKRNGWISPAATARSLFAFMLSSKRYEALIGDLEERYLAIHKSLGELRADCWY